MKMNFEIHIYIGTAEIEGNSSYNYPAGEKHAILLYLMENVNSNYNQTKAEETVAKKGFRNIEFTRVGKLTPEKVLNSEQKKYYENAIRNGSTLIVYADSI
jgi:hypothetical protein